MILEAVFELLILSMVMQVASQSEPGKLNCVNPSSVLLTGLLLVGTKTLHINELVRSAVNSGPRESTLH